jgi:hypothetical protein
MERSFLMVAALVICGCGLHRQAQPSTEANAGTTQRALEEARAKRDDEAERTRGETLLRQQVVSEAASRVGRSLRQVRPRVPDDCSGLVRVALRAAGAEPLLVAARPGDNATTALWREASAAQLTGRGPPRPGDLVFFRDTYDRNRDGKRNDGLTHVGVVESVSEEGVVIHRGGRGVARGRLDPVRPALTHDQSGNRINDYVRRPDGTKGPRLAGELFVGYADARVWLEPLLAAGQEVAGSSRPPSAPRH